MARDLSINTINGDGFSGLLVAAASPVLVQAEAVSALMSIHEPAAVMDALAGESQQQEELNCGYHGTEWTNPSDSAKYNLIEIDTDGSGELEKWVIS